MHLLLDSLSFENPYFLTYRQAKTLGGFVKKGESGFPIIFWQFVEDETSEDRKRIPFLRYYTVFSILQTSGIEIPTIQTVESNPIEEAEKIISEMPNPPAIELGGNQPAYFPSLDLVKIPPREQFDSAEQYYLTLMHEMVHSSGHKSRLNREGIVEQGVSFGSESYSKEELIAELGRLFLEAKQVFPGQRFQLPHHTSHLG